MRAVFIPTAMRAFLSPCNARRFDPPAMRAVLIPCNARSFDPRGGCGGRGGRGSYGGEVTFPNGGKSGRSGRYSAKNGAWQRNKLGFLKSIDTTHIRVAP